MISNQHINIPRENITRLLPCVRLQLTPKVLVHISPGQPPRTKIPQVPHAVQLIRRRRPDHTTLALDPPRRGTPRGEPFSEPNPNCETKISIDRQARNVIVASMHLVYMPLCTHSVRNRTTGRQVGMRKFTFHPDISNSSPTPSQLTRTKYLGPMKGAVGKLENLQRSRHLRNPGTLTEYVICQRLAACRGNKIHH